jgi:DNA-nicking Smr family endonuclease
MGQDHNAFFEAMQKEGVTPIKPKIRQQLAKAKTDQDLADLRRKAALQGDDEEGLSLAPIEWLNPFDPLAWRRDGVQEGVYRNLRLGHYSVDARLDLFHRTPEQALDDVQGFVKECMDHNIRTVLINHGRSKSTDSKANKLKSYLNRWLKNMPEVMCFHSALAQHGGTGATYILLRKSDEARQANLEKHQKRRG